MLILQCVSIGIWCYQLKQYDHIGGKNIYTLDRICTKNVKRFCVLWNQTTNLEGWGLQKVAKLGTGLRFFILKGAWQKSEDSENMGECLSYLISTVKNWHIVDKGVWSFPFYASSLFWHCLLFRTYRSPSKLQPWNLLLQHFSFTLMNKDSNQWKKYIAEKNSLYYHFRSNCTA